ncbi:hypothetical protein DL93DRAFT_2168369 [Clavulina sp. PMI_390]|nr:hypothetical protein DL93DRAFT_2168369 [Clavulina sp. PMI_390]
MRLMRNAVVLVSESSAAGELLEVHDHDASNKGLGEGGAAASEPLEVGVLYRFENHWEKMRRVKMIVNARQEPMITLIPKSVKHEYTLYLGRQTFHSAASADPVGTVRCMKYGPGMDADLTFNNFGDKSQPIKLVVSSESTWGWDCIVRLGGVPVGYIIRRGDGLLPSYFFNVAAGVDVTLFVAIIAAIEKARPKG